MFTTRSRSLPEPATRRHAVVLVGHGSGQSAKPDAVLGALAMRLGDETGFAVRAATLFGANSIEDALRGLAGAVLIVPMFMCDGYTVRQVLPARLEAAGLDPARYRLCPPVGVGCDFSRLLESRARERMASTPHEIRVHVLVGHGTPRNPASRKGVEGHVDWLRRHGPCPDVRLALLDDAPRLPEVLRDCGQPGLVDGIFFADGRHAGDDVLQALRDAGWPADSYLGPAGSDPRMMNLVADRIRRAMLDSPDYCMDEPPERSRALISV